MKLSTGAASGWEMVIPLSCERKKKVKPHQHFRQIYNTSQGPLGTASACDSMHVVSQILHPQVQHGLGALCSGPSGWLTLGSIWQQGYGVP
jgi:hypothetical protein